MTTGPETTERPAEDTRACEERLAEVEAENHLLRESAQAFGDLAERLNVRLRSKERRSGKDRRRAERAASDRRLAGDTNP